MSYKFIDNKGTFYLKNPHPCQAYFPLTNKKGSLLSSISPNLSGDIKKDNNTFITPPVSIEDLRSNLGCRRDFFIKKNSKIIRLSQESTTTLEAGLLYHKLTKKIGSLKVEITNFIPPDETFEVMWVKISNKGKKSIKITPTSFMPLYGRSADNIRDHRHVSSLLNRVELNSYGIFLKPTMVFDEEGHKLNQITYFSLGFSGNKEKPIGQFPTLDYFCGNSDLTKPEAIFTNLTPLIKNNPDLKGKEVVGSLRFKEKTLKAGFSQDYVIITGFKVKASKDVILKSFKKLNTIERVEKSLAKTKKYWLSYLSQIEFDFKDSDFDNWLIWVKFQPTLRKLFGCSFLPHFDYGKGGRGWRDLWQDALTLLLNDPQKAKELIVDSFKGVRIDGSNATIITKAGSFLSDRNKINRIWMDHGIWPYISLSLYINRTGDLEILKKQIPYFKDHLFARAKEIDRTDLPKDHCLRINNKIYRGSILEHVLLQLLTPFFNVGEHNIIKLENADWNDGLDMAANRGESVTFSFMYASHLKDLCFFLEQLKQETTIIPLMEEISLLFDTIKKPVNYNNYKEKQKRLNQYFQAVKNSKAKKKNFEITAIIKDLAKKSEHLFFWLKEKEWLKQGFFNGYYDNKAKKVEGKTKGSTKMMLAPQVFAIMSQGTSDEQIDKIWHSLNKYLFDKKLKGFRLNTDFGSTYLDLGRAFGFAYGDKENGAFFNHMVVMLAHSLYRTDYIEEGKIVLDSIYNMAKSNKAKTYPTLPEYFNNQGRGLYLYLTGSASWYIFTLIEEVLGLKANMGNILIEPKLATSQFKKKTIDINFSFAGKRIKFTYINKAKTNKILSIERVELEGRKTISSPLTCFIPRETLKKIKRKTIQIKTYLS